MCSLCKFPINYLGNYKCWSLWLYTDFGPVLIKTGTFKVCWTDSAKRYNMERETNV